MFLKETGQPFMEKLPVFSSLGTMESSRTPAPAAGAFCPVTAAIAPTNSVHVFSLNPPFLLAYGRPDILYALLPSYTYFQASRDDHVYKNQSFEHLSHV